MGSAEIDRQQRGKQNGVDLCRDRPKSWNGVDQEAPPGFLRMKAKVERYTEDRVESASVHMLVMPYDFDTWVKVHIGLVVNDHQNKQ